MDVTSRRSFALCVPDGEEIKVAYFNLMDLLFVKEEDETEEDYALEEQLDEILDLKVEENMSVYLNRDGEKKYGTLYRTI